MKETYNMKLIFESIKYKMSNRLQFSRFCLFLDMQDLFHIVISFDKGLAVRSEDYDEIICSGRDFSIFGKEDISFQSICDLMKILLLLFHIKLRLMKHLVKSTNKTEHTFLYLRYDNDYVMFFTKDFQ